jgi:hypothetical protein
VAATPHPYPSERFSGRGIVICAGGARLITCAWVTINALRRVVGCTLPVELWHIGPGELGELEAALFSELDVQVIDALRLTPTWPARILGGWELKAYALVHSRFEQVLLLDADNVAVVDPGALFELPDFVRSGAIAWPDVERLTRENPIWEACGVAFRSEPAWETGQFLVDKARSWRPLQIALHMNMHSDTFYVHTHGDKDTFHLAWLMAGAAWAMPEHPARTTTTGIYQRDFQGNLVFQHRSGAKWRLRGPNQLSADFRHEKECLRFLAELRDRWSGTIDALAPATDADRRAEAELSETRWFSLREAGGDDRLLELLPGNRMGIGSTRGQMLRWHIRDGVLRLDGSTAALPALELRGASGARPPGLVEARRSPCYPRPRRDWTRSGWSLPP